MLAKLVLVLLLTQASPVSPGAASIPSNSRSPSQRPCGTRVGTTGSPSRKTGHDHPEATDRSPVKRRRSNGTLTHGR